jgi:hypothetical protein
MRWLERRFGPWWVALPALAGALAALLLPGVSSTSSAEAALLALGALSLLAGHTWGLLVIIPAHISLCGHLWPKLALVGPGHVAQVSSLGSAAISVVLVTALPALALAAILLPRLVAQVVAPKTQRTQALCVAGAALLMAAALVLPAL